MVACSSSGELGGGAPAGDATSTGDSSGSGGDGGLVGDAHAGGDARSGDALGPPGDSGTLSSIVTECASAPAEWIWCDDFEQDRTANYFEGSLSPVPGAGIAGSAGTVNQYTAGNSGAGGLKVAFGRTPSTYFAPVDAGTADYRDIYWRMYLRHPSNWNGGGADKLSRATIMAGSNWAQAMIGHVWSGSDPGAGANYLGMDPASGTDASGVLQTTQYNDFANLRWLGWQRGTTPLFDSAHLGQWHCVEAHVRLNDSGANNGVFELWVNGNLEASHIDLNWVGNYNAYGINAVFIENYWNATSPVDQARNFDNFVVSTARIGCGS